MTKLPKALNRKTISLPSLQNEDGSPYPLVILKISVKQVGMDAAMRLVQNNALAREAAYRSNEGAEDANAVAEHAPYPGTPAHYDDPDSPELKADLLRASEIRACEVACVVPTFAEICEAYDADPKAPWLTMGSDFDELVDAITLWSGYGGGEPRMTGPEAERFPADERPVAGRDGGAVRSAAKRRGAGQSG